MSNINDIISLVDTYYEKCQQPLEKFAKIRKLPNGKYRVLSENGKNLGTYNSRDSAKKRLKQVEFFKHMDENKASDSKDVIDLTQMDDFSFSAAMRQFRQNASKEQTKIFLQLFKSEFDKAIKKNLQKPERVALQNSLIVFNKSHKIKLEKDIVKNAAVYELGNADEVGKYLANIVRFTLNRIKPENRGKAINNLRHKFYYLNENEIGLKELPPASSMGQSITFVKHVLFGHDSRYIRKVLNSLVRSL